MSFSIRSVRWVCLIALVQCGGRVEYLGDDNFGRETDNSAGGDIGSTSARSPQPTEPGSDPDAGAGGTSVEPVPGFSCSIDLRSFEDCGPCVYDSWYESCISEAERVDQCLGVLDCVSTHCSCRDGENCELCDCANTCVVPDSACSLAMSDLLDCSQSTCSAECRP